MLAFLLLATSSAFAYGVGAPNWVGATLAGLAIGHAIARTVIVPTMARQKANQQ